MEGQTQTAAEVGLTTGGVIMPGPAQAESELDHQKRFQAAVDVIHNLPKNGCYRLSYDVMLRFYSLYKQAVCGPCTVPRPSFWDPVGRYKWDAWSCLGEMSSESAMAAYVEEIKKVAQEVINTMPMNEKTASLLQHFEPLYMVIDDMPRPPNSLLKLREGLKAKESVDVPAEMKENNSEEATATPSFPESPDPEQEFSFSEFVDISSCTIPVDSGVSEGLVLTSDSESEIFCDSVDSVEQLGNSKIKSLKTSSFQNGHVSLESTPVQSHVRQTGAGQGGEGAEGGRDHGPMRSRESGREGSYHNGRERGAAQGSARRRPPLVGSGAGQGGGGGSEGGPERLYDAQLQQQIIVALRRLQEDMRSVMKRLDVVERLAGARALGPEWRPCLQCGASQPQEKCWPFDVGGGTVLLLLLWPFVAQVLVYLLRKDQRKGRTSL
ncbi:acyl-CoA-binding domain-containing protein 4 [Thalassophryne amazonica]|uniref:acyl-CoA-binding domain-containing protein 4 n=1 Tax=Thalassophryne amazonica TaxID=390379 RepID=UPI001471B23E|nr:acyl-CoA-binding domain-containing protein 4 [Thalassophryne amazonica]